MGWLNGTGGSATDRYRLLLHAPNWDWYSNNMPEGVS